MINYRRHSVRELSENWQVVKSMYLPFHVLYRSFNFDRSRNCKPNYTINATSSHVRHAVKATHLFQIPDLQLLLNC